MTGTLARANTKVCLARGDRDPMNTDEQLRGYGVAVVTLPGLGHNAHVQSPAGCLPLLETHLTGGAASH